MTKLRKLHDLRKLRGKKPKIPKNFVFFDVESKKVDNPDIDKMYERSMGGGDTQNQPQYDILEFEFGCLYHWDVENDAVNDYTYHTPHDFWQYIDKLVTKKRELYLCAHNSEFDFRQLSGFTYLKQLGFKLKKLIVDNIFIVVAERLVKRKKKNAKTKIKQKLIFFDTMNYVKSSLARLALDFGLPPKLDIDLDNAPIEEKIIYCMRDCEVIYTFIRFIIDYLKASNMPEFALTVSSLTFRIFRRYFYKDRQIKCHNNRHILKLEKEAYYGGLTQAFTIGKLENIDVLDVNSLHPFVMNTTQIPTRLKCYDHVHHNPNILEECLDYNGEHYRIIHCEYELDERHALIMSHDAKNKCIFKSGVNRRVLHEKEFRYIEEHGKILKVWEVLYYEQTNDVFNDFIEYWYNLKQNSQGSVRAFSKFMLNCLYGKFGQTEHKNDKIRMSLYSRKKQEQIKQLPDFSFVHCRLDACLKPESIYKVDNELIAFRKLDYIPAYNSNFAVAGACAANARMYMIELMLDIGLENVHYTDTDSLFVPAGLIEKANPALIGNELGQLKIEHKNVDIHIRGVKNYDIMKDGKIINRKIKGVKKGAKLVGETLEHLIFEQQQWWRLKSSAQKNLPIQLQVIESVIKKIRKVQPKGVLDPSTGRVKPYS
jgi:hypothetical protein